MRVRARHDDASGAGGRDGAVAAPVDDGASAERFAAIAQRVRADVAAVPNLAALARAAGARPPALTSLFLLHAHMTPAAWLLRERTWAAADALHAGASNVHEVAARTGFASEAALGRAFAAVMRMTPGAYRALGRSPTFALQLQAGYRAAEVLAYHGRDPISPAERVEGTRLYKAISTPGGPAVLEIALGRRRADARLQTGRPPDAATMRDAHRIALRLLGLTMDVRGFEAFAEGHPVLAPLVGARPGLHLPLTATVFDGLCWAIVGQQINLAFAFGLRRDVIELAGERIGDLIAHPTPERLAALDVETLRRRRFSRSKAAYLLDTAAAVASSRLELEALGARSAIDAERALTAWRGIGTWTARYVLMRGIGFADAAPIGDAALAAALAHATGAARRPTADEADALMRPFAPYRSLATFHLWANLKDRGTRMPRVERQRGG